MSDSKIATVDTEQLMTKALHDLMLAAPVRDGFCRFYGTYVAKDKKARFPDGSLRTCVGTDTFGPPEVEQ